MGAIETYLAEKHEGSFLLPDDIEKSLNDLFKRPDWILPKPYKIYYADEALPPFLGFPVYDSPIIHDLDARLDRWLTEEVRWQLDRDVAREKAQQAFASYISQATKAAENALLSNLLADYHGIFWLTHSLDVAKQFSSLTRRISAMDTQAGRTQGDTLKYKIFSKWAFEMKEQLAATAAKLAPTLEGEEDRALRFFRLLQDNVLILTEEFISPDLRELRSFVTGYLNLDFHRFRETFERIQNIAGDLAKRDRLFRAGVSLLGANVEAGVPIGLLLDRRFQSFLFEHPAVEAVVKMEQQEQLASVSRRICEFSVLHQLRRAITWISIDAQGDFVAADRRETVYSKTTRPIDFGRPGVVDPMVHRFGLMWDITSFAETLGDVARVGRKGELSSYRQMLVFQRKVDAITERHRLQFEKFLGDGAFYTTRRALRLVRAAVEIQRFYSAFRKSGFAFNRGIRIAVNFGYYRLLPMKGAPHTPERVMEFYGPGVVELSRLTTGKATKEIQEIQAFLVSHGYEPHSVEEFFAPLARGVDVIDHKMHEREFYAYINTNGHLVNEGIVASLPLIQQLSQELVEETRQLYRLEAPWGNYVGFASVTEDVEYIGLRLIGTVSLKGLGSTEIGEIVAFGAGEAQVSSIDPGESLVTMLRHDHYEIAQNATPTDVDVETEAAEFLSRNSEDA